MWMFHKLIGSEGEGEAVPPPPEPPLVPDEEYVQDVVEYPINSRAGVDLKSTSYLGIRLVERGERGRTEYQNRKKLALEFYEGDMCREVTDWLEAEGSTLNMTYKYSEKPIYRDLSQSSGMWTARCAADTVCRRLNQTIHTRNWKLDSTCTDSYVLFEVKEVFF